ncbi:MAG TPA: glycosyltransferase [Candidatus Thermoplasmatota archaeon]|nr:glycosyltransferase [Candidatus Thermoplasmatota archaeon]
MIIELLIILGSIGVLGECYIISLWIIAYRRTKKRIFSPYSPSASVIVPCKGIEHGFHENVLGFLTQEYERYELIFVVDSEDDPAYRTLHKIIQKKPHVHLVLTNPSSECSGKVAALLTGLQSTTNAEVLVFADSDIKPDKNWLQNIITPLQDETIGATTGYRWYFPSNRKTLLISAWNMTSIVFMFYPSYTFAWGGSMAIRKKVFDELDIKTKWKTAFSDDLVLTITVKKAGYKIYLQPKCIMESPPETSIKSFIRWGTRQYTWVRWYYPVFWLGSFFGFIGAQVIIALGLLLLLFGYYLPGVLLSSLLLFEILYGLLGITILPKTMIYQKERYPSKISYALLTPIVFLLLAQNALASALKQEIQWAGRTYRKPKN